jgi:hypothetical protein
MYVLKITSPRRRGADYVRGSGFVTDPEHATGTWDIATACCVASVVEQFLAHDDRVAVVSR